MEVPKIEKIVVNMGLGEALSEHVTDPGREDCAEDCPGCFALTISNLEADLEDERVIVRALIAERDALADRVAELEAHRRTVLKHFLQGVRA